ncbi:MAG: hypothetical protein VW851_05530 [Cryomorphaceae bacterium]
MKFLKNHYRRQLIKAAQPSTNVALDTNASVTVIHSTEEELATVKRYFKRAQGVRWVKEKRSKEQAVNSSVLYLNDINLRGEPAIALPMMTENKHFILNLCNDDVLGWYWYARKYALRVDLQVTYEDTDFTVPGNHSLEDKLETLVNYLKIINHE